MVRQTRGVNFFARGAGLVIIELISPYHLLKSMTNQSEICARFAQFEKVPDWILCFVITAGFFFTAKCTCSIHSGLKKFPFGGRRRECRAAHRTAS